MTSVHVEIDRRQNGLRSRLATAGVDAALIADDDSLAYFAGLWGQFGMEYGRPTLLYLPAVDPACLITPAIELEMAAALTPIGDVRPWADGGDAQWDDVLVDRVGSPRRLRIGIDAPKLDQRLRAVVTTRLPQAELVDISEDIWALRMYKSPAEVALMRCAGEVASAMAEAAFEAFGAGASEYEAALAASAGGTRRAARLIVADGLNYFFSPLVHGLPCLQSGRDTTMAHRRASVRRPLSGEPVYLCFCGMAAFRQYRLAFDRTFACREAGDDLRVAHTVAMAAQDAAMITIRPGVRAEDVFAAAGQVYRSHGHVPGYRAGRGIGLSNREPPDLKPGERTVIREGMTFAVDGAVSLPGRFAVRVSDSVLVTAGGCERLTPYSRALGVF